MPMAGGVSAMGKIRRVQTTKVVLDFTYLVQRCREQTTLPDTPANRKNCRRSWSASKQKSPLGASTMPPTFLKAAKYWRSSRLQAGVHR